MSLLNEKNADFEDVTVDDLTAATGCFTDLINTDTIDEKTLDLGVDIDGINLQDRTANKTITLDPLSAFSVRRSLINLMGGSIVEKGYGQIFRADNGNLIISNQSTLSAVAGIEFVTNETVADPEGTIPAPTIGGTVLAAIGGGTGLFVNQIDELTTNANVLINNELIVDLNNSEVTIDQDLRVGVGTTTFPTFTDTDITLRLQGTGSTASAPSLGFSTQSSATSEMQIISRSQIDQYVIFSGFYDAGVTSANAGGTWTIKRASTDLLEFRSGTAAAGSQPVMVTCFTIDEVAKLRLNNVANDDAIDRVLVFDPADNNIVKWRDATTITNGAPLEIVTGYVSFEFEQNTDSLGTVDIALTKNSTSVTMHIKSDLFQAASASTPATIISTTAIPSQFRPGFTVDCPCWIRDKGKDQPGSLRVETSGVLSFGRGGDLDPYKASTNNGFYKNVYMWTTTA